MDIMDIQAVESKLSDVTVTPIPRSQVQNFYNYQQQREQREQQPQIQISAIHHPPRDRSGGASSSSSSATTVLDLHHSVLGGGGSGKSSGSSGRELYSKRDRDYHQQSTSTSAAAAVAALQYTQQLQAQLALLQQQSNTIASPASTQRASHSSGTSNSSGRSNAIGSGTNIGVVNVGNGGMIVGGALDVSSNAAAILSAAQSQLKYPQSTSPVITTQTSSNITTPMTSTANLPTAGTSAASNGLSKYAQLLAVIEEMGRDIRPTYTGSRSSTERLKRGIVHARILVRECLMETERSARQ
ncbi:uncharacterized protein LOC105231962 [Bactrocera dorsalis]|uniref:Uncharacterized protein LOC105231962 n=1 Tax=Bactrocera dorsalis TaxID=27457 RepID=A0A9B2H7P6_BACDO|nr:uncharacterized protein LOC105231962 [Bactrocera dorsalis]